MAVNDFIAKDYIGSAAATTLNGAISNVATTIVVASGSTWPDGSNGPFVATIERGAGAEERIICSARSGNTVTVLQRGYDGTTGVGHSSGVAIEHTLDAFSVKQANRLANLLTVRGDIYARGATDVQRLALGAAGKFLGSDGTDAAWLYPQVLPPQAIIELSTTAFGATAVGQLCLSTVHQAMMRWTGTQWIFAEGPPRYLSGSDMLGSAVGTAGLDGGLGVTVISSGNYNFDTTVLNVGHAGILQLLSSASANTGARVDGVNSAICGGIPGMRFRCVFRLPAAGFVAGHTTRIGMTTTSGTGAPTDGVFWEIINGAGQLKFVSASSSTVVASQSFTADTWYTTHIWYTAAGTVRVILLKDDGTVVYDATTTDANVPGTARALRPVTVQAFNSGTAALTLLLVDWVGAGYAPL